MVISYSVGQKYHKSAACLSIDQIPDRMTELTYAKIIGIFCASEFNNVCIIEGGYAKLFDEFKPSKLLKKLKESVLL